MEFRVGDIVWRMRKEARKDHVKGNLAPNGEKPLKITITLQNGAY